MNGLGKCVKRIGYSVLAIEKNCKHTLEYTVSYFTEINAFIHSFILHPQTNGITVLIVFVFVIAVS